MIGLVRTVTAISLIALLVSGCTTTSSNTSSGATVTRTATVSPVRQTEMQKAVGRCIATVGVGAVLGGVLGSLSGRNTAAGAMAGAAVGAGACAVLVQVAAAEDQARIRELEREAIRANATQKRQITTKSGQVATVRTTVQPAPAPAVRAPAPAAAPKATPQFTACRYSTQSVEVAGHAASASKQLWCRVDSGEWQPVDA